jgi:hypothetical protein
MVSDNAPGMAIITAQTSPPSVKRCQQRLLLEPISLGLCSFSIAAKWHLLLS